jgi:hypothetical protein
MIANGVFFNLNLSNQAKLEIDYSALLPLSKIYVTHVKYARAVIIYRNTLHLYVIPNADTYCVCFEIARPNNTP